MKNYTIWEAACLTCDIEPDGKTLERLKKNGSKEYKNILLIEESMSRFFNLKNSQSTSYLSKEIISDWFDYCNRKCPEIFKPDKGYPTKERLIETIHSYESDMVLLRHASEKRVEWRKAFEYKSDGLDALYDMIEKYFFDKNGCPLLDPKDWPMKKTIQSSWLKTRLKDTADTIITSGGRKGKRPKIN